MTNFKSMLLSLATLTFLGSASAQNFTPTEYKVTLHAVDLSTDGTNWTSVFTSATGLQIDLANPATFSSVFGNAATISAGSYNRVRMTVSRDLVWSYPNTPVSKTNQTATVTGPPGPTPTQMTVYFATHDAGGKPIGNTGGDGTSAKPFLMGSGATVVAGINTTLRLVFVITNTLVDQGGGNYDLGPPQMFMVSENGDRSTLSGTFNTVLYNQVKVETGPTLVDWKYTSGKGTLTFDGAGNWTWSGTTNDFDLKNGASGALDPGKIVTGRYGTNRDGSIWMLASGEPGTLRGAIASDGMTVVATMYDSPTSHLMFFGVKQATAVNNTSMAGSYYFTTYGSDYQSGSTTLAYESCFGTVNIASGAVTGNSDCNELQIQNPTTTPNFTGPTVSLNSSITDTLAFNANGTMTNTGGKLNGGVLESGDAACIGWNFGTPYDPQHQFGFLVRQSTAGTFSDASLNGTYFGGHFGDTFRNGPSPTQGFFSGFFRINFDGAGSAIVQLLENDRGVLNTSNQTISYSVNTTSGVVTFSDQNGQADIRGAIGPNAGMFILASQAQVGASPNDQRFLGLGLRQN